MNKHKTCKVEKREVGLEYAVDAMANEGLPTMKQTSEEVTREVPVIEQVVEQTIEEGEVWKPIEPTSIDELMGYIPDYSPKENVMCPFHGCLLIHRMSYGGFNYVKCPKYPCAFIASQTEVHKYLEAVNT